MTFIALLTTAGLIAAVGIKGYNDRLRLVEAKVHPAHQRVDRIR